MTKATAQSITASLALKGWPVEFARGEGYCYFIWDEVDSGGFYETHSIMTPYIRDHTLEEWVAMGEAFAAEMRAKDKDYRSRPNDYKLVLKREAL